MYSYFVQINASPPHFLPFFSLIIMIMIILIILLPIFHIIILTFLTIQGQSQTDNSLARQQAEDQFHSHSNKSLTLTGREGTFSTLLQNRDI